MFLILSFAVMNLLVFFFLAQAWGPQIWIIITILAWCLLLIKLMKVASHVLLVLLLLEFFMLLFLALLMITFNAYFSNSNLIMFFFTLAVCEASLGLGLLISLSRKQGSQLLSVVYSFKLFKLLTFKVKITSVKNNLVYLITVNFQLNNLLN